MLSGFTNHLLRFADIPILFNNSRGKETKTASEERKEPEMKPFHGRYREERLL